MEISRGNWRAPRLSRKIYTPLQYDYLTRHILSHENSTLLSTEGRRIAYARACVPHVRLISRGFGFCKSSSLKSATLEQLALESEIKTPVTFKERMFEWNQLCRKGESLFAGRGAYFCWNLCTELIPPHRQFDENISNRQLWGRAGLQSFMETVKE